MTGWARAIAGAPVGDALAALGFPGCSFRLLQAPRDGREDVYTPVPLQLAGEGEALPLARRLAQALAADGRVEHSRARGGFVYFRLADPVIRQLFDRWSAFDAAPWREIPLDAGHPLAPWRSLLLRLDALQRMETYAPGPLPAGSPEVRRLGWSMQGGNPETALHDFEDCFRRGEATVEVVRAVEGWLGPLWLARIAKEDP